FSAQELPQRLDQRPIRLLGRSEHLRGRRRNLRRIGLRRQLYEPCTVVVIFAYLPGDLEPQPRLPHPAGSGQRHQATRAETRPDLLDLALSPDEAAHRPGKAERLAALAFKVPGSRFQGGSTIPPPPQP